MPRNKKIDHGTRIGLRIAESVLAKVELELFSDLQGRVPFGAKSELVETLLRKWLQARGVVV